MTESVLQSTANDTSASEAIVEQLLNDMKAFNEKIGQDRAEIDRLKIETQMLRSEFLQRTAENQALLSRLLTAWQPNA